jgi:hypothetical protein
LILRSLIHTGGSLARSAILGIFYVCVAARVIARSDRPQALLADSLTAS